MIVQTIAELAQSYIAQARSSGRERPSTSATAGVATTMERPSRGLAVGDGRILHVVAPPGGQLFELYAKRLKCFDRGVM